MNIEEINRFVGLKIKDFRTERNWTQQYLSDKTGIGKTTISNYEVGIRSPKKPQLMELANAFDVSVNDFFPTQENSSVLTLIDKIIEVSSKLKTERQQVVLDTANSEFDDQEKQDWTKKELQKIKSSGLKKYEFSTCNDLGTCEVCRKLDEKAFSISSAKFEKNLPPMHSGCRCTINGYFDD